MAEHLTMSQKERTRLGIMREIKAKMMTLVAAARVLRLGYRQMKRVWWIMRPCGAGDTINVRLKISGGKEFKHRINTSG